jgi:hypothetical protein
MNSIAIQNIWQAIRESERNDEIQFMADELPIKGAAARLAQPRRVQSGAVGREPIADKAISPALAAPG